MKDFIAVSGLTESPAGIHTHSGIAVIVGTGCSQKHINVSQNCLLLSHMEKPS